MTLRCGCRRSCRRGCPPSSGVPAGTDRRCGCWCRAARRWRTTASRAAGGAAGRGPARGEHLPHAGGRRGQDGRARARGRALLHAGATTGGGRSRLRVPDGRGTTRPRAGGPAGSVVSLPRLCAPRLRGAGRGGERAAVVGCGRPDVPALLRSARRPIRYAYTEQDQPLSAYQTVFALPYADGAEQCGDAESAARPFTERIVAQLVSRGVQFAPITLHTGVASAESHEPPYGRRFEVPGGVGAADPTRPGPRTAG